MKRGWQAAAVALLVVFAFFAFESLQLSLRDALGPGPGFFPFWLSVVGGGLALILLAQLHSGRAAVDTGTLNFDRSGVRRVTLVLAGLIVAIALLELVGFRLAMLLLIAYVLGVSDARCQARSIGRRTRAAAQAAGHLLICRTASSGTRARSAGRGSPAAGR